MILFMYRQKLLDQSRSLNLLMEKCNLLFSEFNSDLASKKYENRGNIYIYILQMVHYHQVTSLIIHLNDQNVILGQRIFNSYMR